MKYKNFLFDLDGTIADTSPGVMTAYRCAAAAIGADMDFSEIWRYIGPPIAKVVKDTGASDEDCAEFIRAFRECYKESMSDTHLYEGMAELISTIRKNGGRVYVATCKVVHATAKMIVQLGIEVDGYSAADETIGLLEKTDIIRHGAEVFGYPLDDTTVMIGDAPTDISAGRECGIGTVGVLFGFGRHEDIIGEKPDALVNSVAELYDALGV